MYIIDLRKSLLNAESNGESHVDSDRLVGKKHGR